MTTSQTIAPEDRPTIETVRIFDAPRSLVFEAFSQEEHITQWWGPTGFSCRDNSYNFKVGGNWTFIMHHDERGDFYNVMTYTDIVEDELITFNLGDDVNTDLFNARIEFADEGDKTRLTMTMHFNSIQERDAIIEKVGALQGQKETFDRLEAFLKRG